MQRDDFVGIFRVMGERPVTVRPLDPPLHEFMPHTAAEQQQVAAAMGVTAEQVAAKVEDLKEANPMLGPPRLSSGCRLSRDHGHAGARHPRGCLPRSRRKGWTSTPRS